LPTVGHTGDNPIMRFLFALLLVGCATVPAPLPPEPPEPPEPPQTLAAAPPGKDEIVAAMSSIRGWMTRCYALYQQPGIAVIHLTIAPEGTLTEAQTKGQFAGTPTGACAEKAVRKVRFQPFPGAPITIDYPFMLR
jgi:hypothetical protein